MMRFEAELLMRWRREPEAEHLFRAHWQMVGRHQAEIPLEPDWMRWEKLERDGQLAAFTARDGWRLQGYALYLVAPALNYRSCTVAYCHAIYIDPAELKGLAARRFLRFVEFCDRELKSRYGARKTVMHMKLTHDFSRMIEKIGYEPFELLAERML